MTSLSALGNLFIQWSYLRHKTILDSPEAFDYNTSSVTEPMRKFAYFLPAAIYYLVIFFLSSKDYDIPINVRSFDKSAHFVEFAVLGFLLAMGFFNAVAAPVKTKLLLAFFASVSLAGLDEFHQFFVPGRAVEILDLLADALGAMGGILVYLHFCRRRKRLKSGSPTRLS